MYIKIEEGDLLVVNWEKDNITYAKSFELVDNELRVWHDYEHKEDDK